MLNVVMLNDVMLNVIMLNVVMLSVIMLNVIILNVVMLSVIMLSAPAKFNTLDIILATRLHNQCFLIHTFSHFLCWLPVVGVGLKP